MPGRARTLMLTSGLLACGRIGFGPATDADTSGDTALDAAEGPVPPDFVDGTRLRQFRAVGDDGVGEFQGWYDAELDEVCWFQATGDGAQAFARSPQLSGAVLVPMTNERD